MDVAPPAPLQRNTSTVNKRSSGVQPLEIQQILQTNGHMAPKPSPVEHVASPPASPSTSSNSPGRSSLQSRARALSIKADPNTVAQPAAPPPRMNRFSLSFPIQTGDSTSPTRTSLSPTRDTVAVIPEALATATGPSDTSFLTAIAAQERKVLELKEELQKAEADLGKLKKQWAQYEANKKRNDARRVTKLQPVQTSLPGVEVDKDEEGASARLQQEIERRKALLGGGRSSNRTVFEGSRHTRTLSLLSPARGDMRPPPSPVKTGQQQSLPPRKDSLSTNKGQGRTSLDGDRQTRPSLMARASTNPDLTTEIAEKTQGNDLPDNIEGNIDPELLLRTGKKMASDFRDGLWTFFEDLKQVAVGDEASQHQQVLPPASMRKQDSNQTLKTARKKKSNSSLRPSSRGSTVSGKSVDTKRPSPSRKPVKPATQGALPDLANPGFWSDHGVAIPQPTPSCAVKKSPTARGHVKSPSKRLSTTSEDAWDTWEDSPKESRSSSAASETNTLPSSVSGPGSPRQSTDKKDPIPWPALSKLGPATLRRTASHLMAEWEKSLTPSPTKEHSGQVDYLGHDTEAAVKAVADK